MPFEITPEDFAKKMMDHTSDFLKCILNRALSATYGKNWVSGYVKEFNQDVKDKNKSRVSKGRYVINEMGTDITSIDDFDFQACLKLLCHMEKYRQAVFEYYRIDDAKDQKDIKSTAFQLIDFRNEYSHRHDTMNVYACEKVISSMRWLISLFSGVIDEKTGRTYLSEADEIYREFTERQRSGSTSPKTFTLSPGSRGYLPAQAGAAKAKHKSTYIIVLCSIIAVLLLVLIAVLIGFALQGGDDSRPSNVIPREIVETSSVNSDADSLPEQETREGNSEGEASSAVSASSSEESAPSDDHEPAAVGVNEIPSEYQALFEAMDDNWTEELQVGDTHLNPYIAQIDQYWSNVRGYSQDTSIATVGEDNIVTAKAPGVVRILYVGEFMDKDQMYIVEYRITD